jgi:tripartite-type tricarboxylate transporter receptor subunit TctC
MAGVLAFCFAGPAAAQTSAYPTKPITLVVGFTPGGISDVLARALAARLADQMGQAVIVENKPGAATTIAANFVSRAPADGYTLLFQDMTTQAINAAAYKNLPYDSLKDFSLISLAASTPLMLIANPSHSVTNVKDLTALGKAKKGDLAYASSGNGTIAHLAGEAYKTAAKFDSLHVPYKGGAPATQAVLSGEVAYTFSTLPPALSQARAGKVVPLAVTSPKRISAAPNVPTLREAGVPLDLVIYNGVIGPKGMPPDIVKRLGSEIGKAVASPELKKVFASLGADPVTNSPAEFLKLMTSEMTNMAAAVNASGVTLD